MKIAAVEYYTVVISPRRKTMGHLEDDYVLHEPHEPHQPVAIVKVEDRLDIFTVLDNEQVGVILYIINKGQTPYGRLAKPGDCLIVVPALKYFQEVILEALTEHGTST